MRTLLVKLLLPVILLPSLAAAAKPAGWFLAGSDPSAYEIERDAGALRDGKSSGRLASIRESKGFGTMMQSFDSADYKGKRLRLSAWVKAKDVKRWAGVWMRVDGESGGSLAFDNMQSRPIVGTKDWTRYEVVLDVAPNSKAIAFGILLDGEGSVWLNDVQFEVVDASVPVTGNPAQGRKPANLNFEK
jgi:hypothetical protein